MTKLIDKGFHVKLDGFELNTEVQKKIEFVIQEVVFRELAAHHPFGGGNPGWVVVVPNEWLGLILHKLTQADRDKLNINSAL